MKKINKTKNQKNKSDHYSQHNDESTSQMSRSQRAQLEIEELDKRIKEETPNPGVYIITENKDQPVKPKIGFKDLPISHRTIKGLTDGKFFKMTPIQKASLPHSLAGRDIMGASKTGSGKTLSFVIPVLELLYRNRWSHLDGLGALIILPTRELSIQVFEVMNLVGKYHDFSVGMVIGGNNLAHEKETLYKMNILLGTPGRILQHITETPYFSADNLKILAIDEADRILDEGFEAAITEMLSYLPVDRQTLLFSATLTRSLKRLAKVSLKSPEYINLNNTDAILDNMLNEANKQQTELSILTKGKEDEKDCFKLDNSIVPKSLSQYYTLVEAHEKINILYSFFKTHRNAKCLVFVSSCKQVRFFFEIFKKLKLGMTFLDLHGRQKQTKRANIFYTFQQKRNAVLFATDVASRGVDFPAIDWVIQLDCPEDLSTYIHRVGRTARYKSQGNSILFLSQREEKFIETLKSKSIEIKKIKIAPNKITNLQPVVRSILSENSTLIPLAEKAISSYIKSVNLLSNKDIFDVKSIDLQELALSYGLVTKPQLVNKKNDDVSDGDEVVDETKHEEKREKTNLETTEQSKEGQKKKSKLEKFKEKIKEKKMMKQSIGDKDIEDSFLKVKRTNPDKMEEKKTDVIKIKKAKTNQKAEDNEEDLVLEQEEYFTRIKNKLSKNLENDKVKEKMRILEKHQNDRLNRKKRDYEKHGLLKDEDEEANDEGVRLGSMSDEDENLKEETEIKEEKPKVKINLKHASIEDKERLTLELLSKKNSLFG